jgi:hypothetical protein
VLPHTWALVPTLLMTAGAVGGAAVAGIGLADRYATNSFAWDRHTAMDLLAIVGAVSTVAGAGLQVLAKGTPVAIDAASSLGRLVSFRQAVAFGGLATGGGEAVLLSWDSWQQLRDIDADLAGRALFDYRAIYGQEEGELRWTKERVLRYLAVLARAAANVTLMVVAVRAARTATHDDVPPKAPPVEPRPPQPAPRALPEPVRARPPAPTGASPEAAEVRRRVATALREATEISDARYAEGKFDDLVRELRRNSHSGTNAQLLPVVRKVFTALRDPDLIANVAEDVWLEAQAFRGRPDQYKLAITSLSERVGATVRDLPVGRQYDDPQFLAEVVTRRNRFYDTMFEGTEHGALTHMFQDLVVDRALRGTGITSAEEFRSLLAEARGDGGKPLGHDLWQQSYDAYGGVNRPERLRPVLNEILGNFP